MAFEIGIYMLLPHSPVLVFVSWSLCGQQHL